MSYEDEQADAAAREYAEELNKPNTMWEIIDDNGTIYSGSESEIRYIFLVLKNPEIYPEDFEIHKFEWTGDLKLAQIHDRIR